MNEKKKDVGGRPREHDRDDIAEKLIAWAKKDDSLNLCGFCADNLIDPSKVSNWAKECEKFRQSFNIAKTILGNRREQRLSEGSLHMKAYDLNAPTYDYFLKEEKRLEKEFEAQLKEKEQEAVSEELTAQFDNLISQLARSRNET